MKAAVRTRYGTPDVWSVEEIVQPVPKENEILVRVYAATVNRTDTGVLTGLPYVFRIFTGLFKPASTVTGTDFAGRIESVGSKVTDYKVGDRVFGFNDIGRFWFTRRIYARSYRADQYNARRYNIPASFG